MFRTNTLKVLPSTVTGKLYLHRCLISGDISLPLGPLCYQFAWRWHEIRWWVRGGLRRKNSSAADLVFPHGSCIGGCREPFRKLGVSDPKPSIEEFKNFKPIGCLSSYLQTHRETERKIRGRSESAWTEPTNHAGYRRAACSTRSSKPSASPASASSLFCSTCVSIPCVCICVGIPCLFRWIFRLHRLILRSAQLASAEDFQQPNLAYPPIIDHSNPKTNQRRPHLLVPRSEVCCSGETIHRFSSSVPTETFAGFRLQFRDRGYSVPVTKVSMENEWITLNHDDDSIVTSEQPPQPLPLCYSHMIFISEAEINGSRRLKKMKNPCNGCWIKETKGRVTAGGASHKRDLLQVVVQRDVIQENVISPIRRLVASLQRVFEFVPVKTQGLLLVNFFFVGDYISVDLCSNATSQASGKAQARVHKQTVNDDFALSVWISVIVHLSKMLI
ncbi:hypothetical protein LXL04_001609 [Taraxacum kok-saghyz]